MLDAIRLIGHSSDAIEQGLTQAKMLSESQACPILAVSGLLNAGKTSLVAGFLSRQGQSRLLVGSSNQQGTHRFVLWLPEAWRQHPEMWGTAMLQLENIFGVKPEALASEKELAYRQYNGECLNALTPSTTDPMLIPLVATDQGLDRWGIGLMDCPDVQTGIVERVNQPSAVNQTLTESIESVAANRARLLEKALKIASAYIVVVSANSIQDESVSAILNAAGAAMPGLKRILAVNRVPRRYMTADIAREILDGYSDASLFRIYMAYHFDGPLDRHRLPITPNDMIASDPEQSWPVFFRVDQTPSVQPPDLVPMADFLVALGSQLDRSHLVLEMLRSTLISLSRQCRQAWSNVESLANESQQRMVRLHRTLAEASLSLSLSGGSRGKIDRTKQSLRMQVSREIIGQVAESLQRTAPWWAVPSQKLMRWSEQLKQIAGDATKWIAIPSWLSERASTASSWVRAQWRSGEGGRIISATSFGDAIRNYDSMGDLIDSSDGQLSEAMLEQIEQIIARFQAESRTRFQDSQLDEYTRAVWGRMSWRQRLWTGVAPAGLLIAPLVAVVMVPLDFGGTTVLVYASLKELLFAGMASVGMAMISNDQMPQIAEQEAAWQQLSDLFAISCDAFGVPRPELNEYPTLWIGQESKTLLPSVLPMVFASSNSNRKPPMGVYPKFAKQLDTILDRLLSQSTI